MKKLIILSCAIALVFSSCSDKEDPILKLDNRYLESVYGPVPEFELLATPVKNVYLEEFTGHKCTNCPPATEKVNIWEEELGERLVPISIHAGTFANPSAAPYNIDYRTSDGDIYWGQLEVGFAPGARVDRVGGTSALYLDSEWRDLIDDQLVKAPEAALQLVTSYVANDGFLNIHVHGQFLKASTDGFNLVVLITESHIISPQKNVDGTDILDYEHNHMLRDAVTLPQGQPVASTPRIDDVFVSSFSYEFNPAWVPNNCYVIAYLVNNTTGEIVNVVDQEITE